MGTADDEDEQHRELEVDEHRLDAADHAAAEQVEAALAGWARLRRALGDLPDARPRPAEEYRVEMSRITAAPAWAAP